MDFEGATTRLTPQQRELRYAASRLLAEIERTVPDSTAHWVVEDARRAARGLVSYADTVWTRDNQPTH